MLMMHPARAQAGPSKQMNWYNPVNGGSTTPAGVRANDGHAMNGNVVMYDAVAGKIFTCGGAPSYQVGLRVQGCNRGQAQSSS